MSAAVIISGFIMGFAGSLHCVGMCGPLTLLVPAAGLPEHKKTTAILIYHAGRISMYALLGLVTGIVGQFLYFGGMQQFLSISTGIILILIAMSQIMPTFKNSLKQPGRFSIGIQKLIMKIHRLPSKPGNRFLLGAANGLLPCGMVYMALGATLSFAKVSSAISFMAMFGAGTLPALLIFAFGPRMFKPGLRSDLRAALPYFIAITGALLIVRGLNLDYSFISPRIPAGIREIISCH